MSGNDPKESFLLSPEERFPALQRFSHSAMATRWEIFIINENHSYAAQAAAAAFEELDRLEGELSRFLENSDISRLNRQPAGEAMLLGLDAFSCLEKGLTMAELTGGAFDISAGSLYPAPAHEKVISAKAFLKNAKEHHPPLIMDRETLSAARTFDEVVLDLGGIGKGYGVDRIAELLREWDLERVLVHGGASTALALEPPPDRSSWPLSISRPGKGGEVLADLLLHRRALAGSGLAKGPHIVDPRSGRTAKKRRAAWALAPDGATADALSTAFIIMDKDEIASLCGRLYGTRGFILAPGTGRDEDELVIL